MGHKTDALLPWFLGNKGIEAYKRSDNYVVLDYETTNKTTGLAVDPENKIVLSCWTVVRDGVETEKSLFGDEYELQELVNDTNAADFVVAHNAKFEAQWLHRCGVDLRTLLVFDTFASEWVIQGNRKVPLTLEGTARRYRLGGKVSLVSKLIKLGVCPSLIPRSWLLQYCKEDVRLCHDVFKKQKEVIEKEGLWHLVLQRNLVVPVLADIELQGLQLDKEAVYVEEERLQNVIEELGEELDGISGGINLGSPKQLRELLYEKLGFDPPRDNGGKIMETGSGEYSTAVPALAKLVASSKEQVKFLALYKDYNLASSLLSKNVAFFKKVCEEKDGVFYGQLRQGQTANHRLASSGVKMQFKDSKKETAPQLQNLPRQYKSLFTSHDPDYEVTEYDGSQIEFRVAAELGHDEVAESDIVNGVDIHSFTRDTMNAAYLRMAIKKEIDRQAAKPHTFAPLYGAFGKDAAEQEYAKAFREKYFGIYDTQKEWTLIVADRKKLTTPYGLTFHWPNATISRSGYVSYSTEIFNLPISGFATGEIIPIALVFFWFRTANLPVYIFNTIHDSIVVRQRKEVVEQTTNIAKQCFTHDVYSFLKDVYNYQFRVPLGFGAKSGVHWGVTDTEHKYDVWPSGEERYQIEERKEIKLIYDTRGDKSRETSI